MGGPGEFRHGVHVGDHVLEVLDHHPLAVRAPVPGVVRGVDRGAVTREDARHLLVAPGVLAVPVDQQRDVAGGLGGPLADGDASPRSGQGVLAGPGHVSSGCVGGGRPEDLPRTASGGL